VPVRALLRINVVPLAVAAALLVSAHLVADRYPTAVPVLVAAGCALAAAGGGVPGLLLAAFGAGLAPLDTPERIAFAVGSVVVFERVTRTREEAERISEASMVDALTGLYTYAYFEQALEIEVRRARRYGGSLSLLLLDLDRFKGFNDRHGHAAGNDLLAAVGRELQRVCRDSDVVARFGGEEIAVLVPGPSRDALVLAERARAAIGDLAIDAGGRLVGTTVSIGVAETGPGTRSADDLFAAADSALYAAKHAGRNRVTLAPSTWDAPAPVQRSA
jgi:diguanylate cyclase (GGDEF)-like protein